MSKLSFRARALDASKPMPIYLAEELPDLPDYSAINRAVPQMPSGMEKEEESEHHLQRAISGTGLIIPTPEVCQVNDIEFYERCYPPDYKMPKQHIHMQPLWEEQEAPEYDMDSEDERWLKQQGHPELTELKFEQMMDKLEKSSGQTVVTLNEAKLLLERQDDLVIAVYDYWLNKRLTTQHPLILSVKTENRPGQSSNNPYLAFRRRTEKMQTRKNRKNDESSYEKMLKLRRDLARALNLLELVARRERAKRELVKLTALLAERRYVAGDFANQLLPDPPPRPAYTAVPLTSNFRREAYSVPHYPPRPPPTPVDQPRQREKRTYKRRKHRHAPVGAGAGAAHAFRDSGVYTSSEEESSRVEPSSPPDDGPFAFRRKPGCYYEMPTSTLNGDPVDAEDTSKDRLYQHEIDPRHRYTLTSINEPYRHCIGFARRRVGRGGRILLDRIATPLDDLWPHLPFHQNDDTDKLNERELENKWHRTPKEITRDYHTSGKYPWRHAFRRHLSRHPELWVQDAEPKVEEPKPGLFDGPKPSGVYDGPKPSGVYDESKPSGVYDGSSGLYDFKSSGVYNVPKCDGLKSSGLFDSSKSSGVYDRPNSSAVYDRPNSNTVYDRPNSSNIYDESKTCVLDSKSVYDFKTDVASLPDVIQDSVKSESGKSARSFEVRKRSWSDCSDSSYDSDESLYPVEKEFEKFIDEVNRKWLHFRPKTPPPSPPLPEPTDTYPIEPDTPIAVEIRGAPTDGLTTDTFTTTEFTLGQLYPDVGQDVDSSGTSLDISGDDLLGENFTGLTEDQMESILSETDLKSLDVDEKKMNLSDDILDVLVNDVDGKEPFLLQGQSKDGRIASGPRKKKVESFGSSCVIVTAGERERVQCSLPPAPPAPAPAAPAPATRAPPTVRPSTSAPVTLRAHSSPHPPALRIPPKLHPVEVITPAPAPAPAPDPNPVPVTVAVPNSKIIVEEVNEVTLTRDNKKSHDTIEEIQLPHGVQLKTVQTKHSPLKKHIITSAAHTASVRARSEAASSTVTPTVHVSTTQHAPQIVTVAVSDSLKVRLQNHLLSNQSGVLVQNGPFPPVVAVPMQQNRETGVSTVSIAGTSGTTRRVSAPLVQLAPGTLHKSAVTSVASVASGTVVGNKLKVVHAHPLSAAARAQLLQARHLQHLPTVVSLAALDASKQTALIKTPGSQVAQLFEIKGGAHLVNVVRPPAPTRLARLDPRLLRPAHLLRKDKQPLAANLQAIAFTAPGGLKARTARLVPPRAAAPNPPAQHHPAPDDRA